MYVHRIFMNKSYYRETYTKFCSSMKTLIGIVVLVMMFGEGMLYAQSSCDNNTPSTTLDFSNNSDTVWVSPSIQRRGNCCSTSNPDRCLEFVITLSEDAEGLEFDIDEGAEPSGSGFYQINCGPLIPLGTTVCLSGPGPHYLTMCKPGANENTYTIRSVPKPVVGPPIAVNDGCTGFVYATGFQESTIEWNTVYPGSYGDYNGFMSCQTACDTVVVTAAVGYPAYIDFEIRGLANSECTTDTIVDTVRVYFNPSLLVALEDTVYVCAGYDTVAVTANGGGGTPPYSFVWSTGDTTASVLLGPGQYTVEISDTSDCPPAYDTIQVVSVANNVEADAGADSIYFCSADSTFALTGTVVEAIGGVWFGGEGSFSPSDTGFSVDYAPSAAEYDLDYIELYYRTYGSDPCPSDTDTVKIFLEDLDGSLTFDESNSSCKNADDAWISLHVQFAF
ncbi:MAG: hypothetical protein ACI8ZO_000229, partial [Flavobacteriales bacterium]